MAKKKNRIDVTGPPEGLTHSPFAALGGKPAPAPSPDPAPEGTEQAAASDSAVPFRIGKTRKGGFALAVERRPGGKVVTILGNVEGDSEALLTLLKKRCGAGGAVREGAVELQGDHRERLEALLREGLA